ncbi:MAG: hypothetical protein LAP21_08455 [Acidobacteriia bacterium]|nr:hypothetical protein [Terriglobia bacterium]
MDLTLNINTGQKHIVIHVADADAVLTKLAASTSAYANGAGELKDFLAAIVNAHSDTDRVEVDASNILQVVGK